MADISLAANFGYILEDPAVADLRLGFDCRSSPGFWGLLSAAVKRSQNHTLFRGAVVSEIARDGTLHFI